MHRLYLRQGNITFCKAFVDNLREKGIILTRRDTFNRNGVMINHGNSNDIKYGKKVNRFYLLNHPNSIMYTANKMRTYKLLPSYHPKVYENRRDIRAPVIAKPRTGHHGYGIKILNTNKEVDDFFSYNSFSNYIVEDLIDIKHEYRFNVVAGEVYQVSKKIKQDMYTEKGGYVFAYKSLGSDAKISQKFWDFVNNIIKDIERKLGNKLGSYCIDIIKGQDGEYYLTELNSAYGIGQFTLETLINTIDVKYNNGELEDYRVI